MRFPVVLLSALIAAAQSPAQESAVVSHPPLRTAPPPAKRPAPAGPVYHADARKGNDEGDGTQAKPWRTIGHSLTRLKAGDTLYLHGGTYYENVHVALVGKPEAPITFRSAPGEQAILDGSLREFFEDPAKAWEPLPKGAPGEFRSSQRYPNLRDVAGSFGDSMIGLQTYYHARDFRSQNEFIDWEDWNRTAETDIKPLYCGPGVWYDPATGHIHARLAHTNMPAPVVNYRGATDPRKLPLILAPFRSVTLLVNGGRHVRFQDLIIRGGGYHTVDLDHAIDIEFDNVTVWCGTYGIRAAQTGPFRFVNGSLHGNVAPWTFRNDASKRDYPGRPHRNISRLNTHALIEIDAGRESSVFATPQNDRWEIAHSDFTDAHDGAYLGGINVRFHHNRLDNLQDDGIYLSPMYHRHRLDKIDPEIHIYENVFTRMLTALAFGGTEAETRDRVFVYRNIFDQRGKVSTGRPSAKLPVPGFSTGKLIGDHGSPPWSALNFYHNTCVSAVNRQADMATYAGTKAGNPRRVFNNVFWHTDKVPGFVAPDPALNVVADGNLYAGADADKLPAGLQKFRTSKLFEESKKLYPLGSMSQVVLADPQFVKAGVSEEAVNDYRLMKASPAVDAGVALPADWPDPFRKLDAGRPDIGALPLGAKALLVGRGR